MTGIRKLVVRAYVAWQRFKAEERGAQTLEWLALALLLLAILGTAASLSGEGFGQALKNKFLGLVNKIDQ
jgi:Flp pilus assembly pilin Flp